ncbi:MAG TPA: RidA family protein [Gallionella sp.]|nr:RidA family protein [Gallionella sp.]
MANRKIIQTPDAPAVSGTYSQAVCVNNTVYLSGQIGVDPGTMLMVEGIEAQIHRVFQNLRAVASAADSSFNDLVKLNVYLTDLKNFAKVNEIMAGYFRQPYPARSAVGVAKLPHSALVEMDGVLVIQD